ncbi:MAG: AraC family transcriptional regulator [Bacteroidales bacterium]|nr:AraC family transcriptional regulator [Bacteroidales bacterium]
MNEYAAKLIAGSESNFGNIEMECGYNSISYFNQQFKRIMKVSPMTYRKKFSTNFYCFYSSFNN